MVGILCSNASSEHNYKFSRRFGGVMFYADHIHMILDHTKIDFYYVIQ